MTEFPTSMARDLDLDLGSGHTAHITHRPLPTHEISWKSKKLFVDGRTGGLTFETHFIRSTRRSQPNKYHLKSATSANSFSSCSVLP